jgi:hypothetical protein
MAATMPMAIKPRTNQTMELISNVPVAVNAPAERLQTL